MGGGSFPLLLTTTSSSRETTETSITASLTAGPQDLVGNREDALGRFLRDLVASQPRLDVTWCHHNVTKIVGSAPTWHVDTKAVASLTDSAEAKKMRAVGFVEIRLWKLWKGHRSQQARRSASPVFGKRPHVCRKHLDLGGKLERRHWFTMPA